VFRASHDTEGLAASLRELGVLHRLAGDVDVARGLLEEGLQLLDGQGGPAGRPLAELALQPRGRSRVLADLADLESDAGDVARAASLLVESAHVAASTDNRLGVAEALTGLAALAAELGEPERAVLVLAAAERLRDDGRDPVGPAPAAADRPSPRARRPAHVRVGAALRAALGDARFRELEREGRALSLDQAVRLAGTLGALGALDPAKATLKRDGAPSGRARG
jgi:hypothetical protein